MKSGSEVSGSATSVAGAGAWFGSMLMPDVTASLGRWIGVAGMAKEVPVESNDDVGFLVGMSEFCEEKQAMCAFLHERMG